MSILTCNLCLALNVTLAALGQDTASQQYQSLLAKYNIAAGQFRKAQTDQQRKAAVEGLSDFPTQFVTLAENNPKDPVAILALRQAIQAINSTDSLAQHAWETNRADFPSGSRPDSAARAIAVLRRNHIQSDMLDTICERMRWAARTEYEAFLETLLRTSEHRNVKAVATLALAQVLKNQMNMIDLIADRPEMMTQYRAIFGKHILDAVHHERRDSLAKRIESRFEEAAKYEDVMLPFGGTVAEKPATNFTLCVICQLANWRLRPSAKIRTDRRFS